MKKLILAPLLALLLAACQPSETTRAVPYGAVNHTDVNIASIVINGEGGVENIGSHEAGNAGMCCAIVPRYWTPGLTATVKWQEDSTLLLDKNGQEVKRDGVPVLIEGAWKTRTVPIPRYEGEGRFFVFFFPGDDVRVAMTSSPEWKTWWKPTPEDIKHGTRVNKE
jgi:hypothetical protein